MKTRELINQVADAAQAWHDDDHRETSDTRIKVRQLAFYARQQFTEELGERDALTMQAEYIQYIADVTADLKGCPNTRRELRHAIRDLKALAPTEDDDPTPTTATPTRTEELETQAEEALDEAIKAQAKSTDNGDEWHRTALNWSQQAQRYRKAAREAATDPDHDTAALNAVTRYMRKRDEAHAEGRDWLAASYDKDIEYWLDQHYNPWRPEDHTPQPDDDSPPPYDPWTNSEADPYEQRRQDMLHAEPTPEELDAIEEMIADDAQQAEAEQTHEADPDTMADQLLAATAWGIDRIFDKTRRTITVLAIAAASLTTACTTTPTPETEAKRTAKTELLAELEEIDRRATKYRREAKVNRDAQIEGLWLYTYQIQDEYKETLTAIDEAEETARQAAQAEYKARLDEIDRASHYTTRNRGGRPPTRRSPRRRTRQQAEDRALKASQHRAHIARQLDQGQATMNDYRRARHAEDAAHREAETHTETMPCPWGHPAGPRHADL